MNYRGDCGIPPPHMAGKLFGTDGIRGVANQHPITPEVALRLGRAVARVLEAARAGR